VSSVINAAQAHWALGDAPITLIAARENQVYRVDTSDGPVALRLHRPGYRSDDEIRSELLWMDRLAEVGLAVPKSIEAIDGSCVQRFEGVVVSVLTWLDGTPFSKVSLTTDLYFELGCVLAQMHQAVDEWKLPEGFTRPTWNLVGEQPTWDRFWENPLLTPEQSQQLLDFRHYAACTIAALNTLDEGLIHADLIPDNVLTGGKQLQLIDFDDGGFGPRLFDLATITHRCRRDDPSGAQAEATIAGYSTYRAVDRHMLTLFEALRACTYVGWNISRMEEPNGFVRNARYIAEAELAISRAVE